MTTDCALARAVNVGWQAKEGRFVLLRKRGNDGHEILREEIEGNVIFVLWFVHETGLTTERIPNIS